MSTLHYLAYGSNLHPLRLLERISSARMLGVVPMPGRAVKFHKRSYKDLSGKCDLVEAPGTVTSFGVLYELAAADKQALDVIEGVGYGYREALVDFSLDGVAYRPFVYAAEASHIVPSLSPYRWYKAMVLAGARHHEFPGVYIAELEAISSIADPDATRTAENEALLARMAAF